MTHASIADAPAQLWGPHRRLDEDDRATEPGVREPLGVHEQEDTDEQRAGEPTADSGDPLQDSAPRSGSFEHRRIIDVARRQLFGRGRAGAERSLRIGRYAIERRIGSGGMGDVYLAHDAALDRKVAIKRVRVGSARERDQERLRREARALARLSHPNVVQVYEVDEHEGRTFLAMEYVAGETLGEWLADAERSWRAVLEVFLAAGRGLAAAHGAGLVHRDFKPDNVLLGRDGSVRVADFGLVLAGEDQRITEGDASSSVPAETRMSVTGSVLGTIRYMPLEQLLGHEVDARSDQFSFCVALYEAVWRRPPFSLASSLARLTDLQTCEPAVPRARQGSRPPAALWRVIERGLRREPEERWPDMPSLLAALEGVTRRRRRLAWMGGTLTAAALVVGAVMAGDDPAEPCAAVSRELEGAWDEERREALATAVAALSAGHVGDSEQRVASGLDRWSEGWTEARTDVCLALAEQRIEPELARGRNTCLARQRQRVGDLVELLLEPQGANADTLAGAIDAVAELPPASACEDEPMLGPPPPPAAIAEEVEALRREVDRAHELRLLGRVEEGLALAERMESAAKGLGYGPLLAEALAERARAESVAGSLSNAMVRFEAAVDAAELHHHDKLGAELWTELAVRTLVDLGDQRAGAWQLRRAEVSNARIDAPTRSSARLVFARGQLAELQGDTAEAERSYRAALTQTEQDDASAADVPSYWSNLARLVGEHDASGRAAIPLHQAALDAAEAHYGPNHPHTAEMAYLLGSALQGHDPDRAAHYLRRAANIWTTSHTHPHRELAKAHMLIAKLAMNEGDLVSAEHHARLLAEIQASDLPAEHIDRGDPAYLLAIILAVQGEHERALEQARLALALWEPVYGPGSLVVQRLHSDVAAMLLALGRIDEAAEELDLLPPLLPGSPEEVSVRVRRCEIALRRGHLDDAKAELRALEHLSPDDLGAHELSHAVLRALIGLRRNELPPDAIERLRRARGNTLFTSHQLDAWYDQLGMTAAERALVVE